MGDYTYEEKQSFDGKKVKVLGPTYEAGKPEGKVDWEEKFESAEGRLAYLKASLRYWYSKDWFGSEKRKSEA